MLETPGSKGQSGAKNPLTDYENTAFQGIAFLQPSMTFSVGANYAIGFDSASSYLTLYKLPRALDNLCSRHCFSISFEAHRPPVEDVEHFLISEKSWIIPTLFADKSIKKIAHSLAGR